MKYENEILIEMDSKSQNEAFARIAVAAFVSHLDPTVTEITDIKTAVSEAVTNAIIHGYENKAGKVFMKLSVIDYSVTVIIKDFGLGIEDIEKAREPLYTSKPELERSGMGFTVMESFMDSVIVRSEKGVGTEIIMTKKFSRP